MKVFRMKLSTTKQFLIYVWCPYVNIDKMMILVQTESKGPHTAVRCMAGMR